MDRQILAVALLHGVVEMLLLLAVNRLTGDPPEYFRGLTAAMLGAIYSGVCMLPGFHFLGNGFWHLVCLTLMAWTGFGGQNRLRRGALFCLLSMAFSGLALGFGRGGVWPVVLGAIGVGVCCIAGFRGDGIRRYVPVVLRHGDRRVSLTALRDSGNTLRDPVTGQPVLVIGAGPATALTGLSREQLRAPVESIKQLPGLRLIPFQSVGRSDGLLLALRLQDVTIGTWKGSCLVAFAPDGLENSEFQALTGGMV